MSTKENFLSDIKSGKTIKISLMVMNLNEKIYYYKRNCYSCNL